MDDLIPDEGIITIRWKRLPETDRVPGADFGFDWAYEPDPPLPDAVAERLLREIADRL